MLSSRTALSEPREGLLMLTDALQRVAWAPRAGPRPAHGLTRLLYETIVAAPLDEVFAFFADAANLERLTPPWLNFEITTPMPVTMREGLEIDYRIVLHGIPIPWRTLIDVWEPGVRFVDRQMVGPYRWWHHQHRFEAVAGGTRVVDEIEFVPRARWLSQWYVKRDVERIFGYRSALLPTLFERGTGAGERGRMTSAAPLRT
jgi:ligand-binding SRPBCC domain-containing protein